MAIIRDFRYCVGDNKGVDWVRTDLVIAFIAEKPSVLSDASGFSHVGVFHPPSGDCLGILMQSHVTIYTASTQNGTL